MSQLAVALRDPQRRRAIEEGGGDFDYTDCFELLDDMVALRRAFPDATILDNNNPMERRLGFLAYWLRDGDEVVVYFGMRTSAVQMWVPEGQGRHATVEVLRKGLLTAEGRVTIIREVEREAARPLPRSEVIGRPTIWERLMADDD